MPLIECTIRRPDGTHVDIKGTDYWFRPASEGEPHLAQVAQEHVQPFLDVPESFRVIEEPKKSEPTRVQERTAPPLTQKARGYGSVA